MLAPWKRWARGEGDPTDESELCAAALAALNILAAALSLLWLVLAHPGGARTLPIACATFAFCAVATVLIAGRWPKPSWMLQTAIALDTLAVSVCLVATRDPSSVYAFYYLCVGLYAACFSGCARSRSTRRGWASPTPVRSHCSTRRPSRGSRSGWCRS